MLTNRQRRVRVPLAELNSFVRRVQSELGLAAETFAVAIVSNAEIARLNRRFRGKRGPTDVLSFPAGRELPTQRKREAQRARRRKKPPEHTDAYLGDIAISAEAARRNARRYRRSLGDELRILILHGALHLLGYDHETDAGEMERVESRLRRSLGIAVSPVKR